jgi:7-cyano-7-deazaguanine synthase
MNKPTAIVLHSGGLDSTTCLAVAVHEGYEPHALAFDYGQRHSFELEAAKRICHHRGIKQTILSLPISQLGGSALTDFSIAVPDHTDGDEIPVTYVPARNLTFLSYAVGLAEVLAAEAVYIGVSCIDYSSYPDCRPEFIQSFQQTANLATKAGVEGNPIAIKTPLIHLSKAETIQLGMKLGVDYANTVSCYQANSHGLACGRCDSCMLRKKGFTEAGVPDPTRYQ